MIPARSREEYFPVFYLETLQKNAAAFGFDVNSEPRRRQALERARDTGKVTATATLRLAQEPGSQLGFLVFQPLYAGALPPRRNNAGRNCSGSCRRRVSRGGFGRLRLADHGRRTDLAATITDEADGSVIYTQRSTSREPVWDTVLEARRAPGSCVSRRPGAFGSAVSSWQSRWRRFSPAW